MSSAITFYKETPPTAAILEVTRQFYTVGGKDLEKLDVIAEIFNRVLKPLYGPQEKAIEQIKASTDRKDLLLYETDIPLGVLVFKTTLSNEFAELGIRDSIEIKSLFVDHAIHHSGRGLGSALIAKLFQEVKLMDIHPSGIHVTVSETKQESLDFFQKKRFQIVHQWIGRYQPNTVEYLLFCPSEILSNALKACA